MVTGSADIACTKHESAVACWASRMGGELHPTTRTASEAGFRAYGQRRRIHCSGGCGGVAGGRGERDHKVFNLGERARVVMTYLGKVVEAEVCFVLSASEHGP